MIADKGWGVTNYDDYMTRITDDYLLYRSPVLAFDVISYRSCSKDSEEHSSSTQSAAKALEDDRLTDTHKQFRFLSAGITFRYNQTFLQVKNIIKTILDSYNSTAYSSNAEKTEGNVSCTSNTQTVLTPQDDKHFLEKGESDETKNLHVGKTNVHFAEGSPKLHPPVVEDYDALMEGVPLCKYKIELKRMRFELFAKTEPESSSRVPRKLPSSLKSSLPYILLYFDKVEGTLSTPSNPDKLVHTTCQLPDKPQELLNACYDTYDLHIKDFSMGLVSPTTDQLMRLINIPKLQLTYGSLLQPYFWKCDEVPVKKLDLQCDTIKLEFSKREFVAAALLTQSILNYNPLLATKIVEVLNVGPTLPDGMVLNSVLSKLALKQCYYHTFGIWNLTLTGFNSDIAMGRKSPQTSRSSVFTTQTRIHNNQSKWLEMQLQYPNMAADEQPLNQASKYSKKDAKMKITMALGIWVEKFNFVADKNLFEFLSFVVQEDNKNETGKLVNFKQFS